MPSGSGPARERAPGRRRRLPEAPNGYNRSVNVDLSNTIALLASTPAALDGLLRHLPDAFAHANEGGDSWTPLDIVGHLIHGERTDWMPRLRIILADGESRTFAPFDMRGHEQEIAGRSMGDLLDELARLRARSVGDLRAMDLQPEDLQRRGRHPEFGPVSASEMLATWAAHDLTHLHQLSRVLAYPYREAVGPWQAYLGVLHCAGHSAK